MEKYISTGQILFDYICLHLVLVAICNFTKINERMILKKGCRFCEQEYLSLFPALAVSYYSNKKGLKAELGSDRLLGVPLETYIAWLCEVQRYDRRESNLCVDKVGVFNAEEVGISFHQCLLRTDEAKH